MRRFLPILIVVVGLAALAVNFLPLDRPLSDPPQPIETRLGLDLQGGLRGEYRALPADGVAVTAEGLATIRTIIENRINQYGVAEPIVQTQGNDRIVVEIPGVTNESDVRGLIGSTGRLDFVEVPPARANEVIPGGRIPADLEVVFSGDKIASASAGFDRDKSARGRLRADRGGRADLRRLHAQPRRRAVRDRARRDRPVGARNPELDPRWPGSDLGHVHAGRGQLAGHRAALRRAAERDRRGQLQQDQRDARLQLPAAEPRCGGDRHRPRLRVHGAQLPTARA